MLPLSISATDPALQLPEGTRNYITPGGHARIRAELEAAGTPIGPHDTLIAATALRHQATLVTRNEREFSRVAGLLWVNWHLD